MNGISPCVPVMKLDLTKFSPPSEHIQLLLSLIPHHLYEESSVLSCAVLLVLWDLPQRTTDVECICCELSAALEVQP